jgi:hypothetical protein
MQEFVGYIADIAHGVDVKAEMVSLTFLHEEEATE